MAGLLDNAQQNSIAGLLGQIGVRPGDNLRSKSQDYFANLPQEIESNQRQLDRAMAGMFEMDMATGKANPLYYPEAINEVTQMLPGFMGSTLSKVPKTSRSVSQFDPRFDPRVGEQDRLKNLTTVIEGNTTPAQKLVSLVDFEGRPFITSMSDRTAAGGELVRINNVDLNRPVGLLGGQDYMFNNPGQVWASGQKPATDILELAQDLKSQTGQNPLYLPWRMTPSGGDFANMTYETMINYAESALGKTEKKAFNKTIKEFIPDWKGVDSKESVQQLRDAPDTVRKAIMKQVDKQFRDSGGLNIGEARLAVADPKQLTGRTADIMNVGEVFADRPMIMQSGHPSYPLGVPGQGLGIIDQPRSVFELLPQMAKERGIADPKNWSQADRRALEMKPYGGIINSGLLKSLGY